MLPARTVRVLALLSAVVLLLFGAMKFLGGEMVRQEFEQHWGYPAWFAYVTGVLELTAGGLLLVPRVRFHGAILASFIMLGAVVTHLRVPEVGLLPLALVVLGCSAAVAWTLRHGPVPADDEASAAGA